MLVILLLALVLSTHAYMSKYTTITGQFIADVPSTSVPGCNQFASYVYPNNVTLSAGDTYIMYLQLSVLKHGVFMINIPGANLEVIQVYLGDPMWCALMLYKFRALSPMQLSSLTPILTIKAY